MSLPSSNPQPDTPEARQYNRAKRWLEIADLVVGVAFLAILLLTGWNRSLRDISMKIGRDHYALQLFVYVLLLSAISKFLGIGLDFYSFRLEHRFNLSNQKLSGWIKDEIKGWVLGLVMATFIAEIIYALIRTSPTQWWIIAWLVFIALFVLFAQIAPVVLFPLFYKFAPLQNEELKSRLMRLGERAGTRIRGVYEWKLSEKSKKANAALTGLGSTRRIIIADTLLQNCNDDEIEAIMAHELGHQVHRHILKSIVIEAGVTLVGFWAANWVLQYATTELKQTTKFQHLTDFANLPLLVLVSSVLSILLMPALNAYSRLTERQADLYCWKSVPSVTPFITAMEKLTAQNLSERSPSRLVEVLFHSHPPISKRIAAAEAWANTNRPSLAT
ncbi:MAG TPA: M48 family metallopeptidase [Candidatus Angelobacter sp.]|jgi:STE24 endopeptidase|nr:M48 family metallopeptidase [Candidatus Angelobacter sp.]